MALLRNQKVTIPSKKVSSFASVQKILEEVVGMFLKNEDLKRLLYYSDKHALSLPNLNQEQTFELINKNIRTVPKLTIDDNAKSYIIIGLEKFEPVRDGENHFDFRSMILSIDILSIYDDWQLDDFQLRPYSIAGEVDGMIRDYLFMKDKKARFLGADQLLLNDSLGGISLFYKLEPEEEDIKESDLEELLAGFNGR